MSKEKAESTQDFTADFARELGDLQDGISKVRADFQGVLDQITAAEKVKEGAKQEYALRLDQGNEQEMSNALRLVRESNSTLERLRGQLPAFQSRVEDLRAQQTCLDHAAQADRKKMEAVLEETQRSLQTANTRIAHARGLMNQLNNLQSFVRGEPERSM